jgi:hypothetical protein
MTPQELLDTNGIRLKDYKPGNHTSICPECSHKRSRANQKTECLSVKIDARGAAWKCHHCGWFGPVKGKGQYRSNGAGGNFAATFDYPGFQKVKYPKGHVPRFRIRHCNSRGDWEWGAGGADTSVLILKSETSGSVTLFGRGRDLEEIEKGLEFDKNACTWRIVGDAAAIRLTKEREKILDALEEAGIPVGPREIAQATGMKEGNVRRLLRKMHKEGLIKQPSYGKYTR